MFKMAVLVLDNPFLQLLNIGHLEAILLNAKQQNSQTKSDKLILYSMFLILLQKYIWIQSIRYFGVGYVDGTKWKHN